MSPKQWTPSPGHIIRTSVPHTDSPEKSDRYPVVVSSLAYNQQCPDVIVAFATRTSNIHHPRTYDVELSDRHPEFNLTGLTENTTVRCGRLHTITKRKIYDVIGIVPDNLFIDIERLVLECFRESTDSKKV